MKIWIFNDGDSDYYFTTEELAKEYAKYRIDNDFPCIRSKEVRQLAKEDIETKGYHNFNHYDTTFQVYSENINDFKFW